MANLACISMVLIEEGAIFDRGFRSSSLSMFLGVSMHESLAGKVGIEPAVVVVAETGVEGC